MSKTYTTIILFDCQSDSLCPIGNILSLIGQFIISFSVISPVVLSHLLVQNIKIVIFRRISTVFQKAEIQTMNKRSRKEALSLT